MRPEIRDRQLCGRGCSISETEGAAANGHLFFLRRIELEITDLKTVGSKRPDGKKNYTIKTPDGVEFFCEPMGSGWSHDGRRFLSVKAIKIAIVNGELGGHVDHSEERGETKEEPMQNLTWESCAHPCAWMIHHFCREPPAIVETLRP